MGVELSTIGFVASTEAALQRLATGAEQLVRRAGREGEQTMRNEAPVGETGGLERAITRTEGRDRSGFFVELSVEDAVAGHPVFPVEFGTRHSAPRPFFRRGLARAAAVLRGAR